ncbi:MAG: GNAT family N-acetyltransferase [Proteobacteria bacterium]|nr:GNAT family N-acetyltransferase [Pseudomonadota bacterium]
MEINLLEATLKDKPVIRNMLQLYLHDFSELDGDELDEHGLYNYDFLDHYWTERDRYPFVVRVNTKLAGFVLLNRHTFLIENALAVGEFFIVRKYRRQGIGRKTAMMIFNKFPGAWEIRQTKNNTGAQKFWKDIVREYTNGDFQEYENAVGWDGPIQCFQNT